MSLLKRISPPLKMSCIWNINSNRKYKRTNDFIMRKRYRARFFVNDLSFFCRKCAKEGIGSQFVCITVSHERLFHHSLQFMTLLTRYSMKRVIDALSLTKCPSSSICVFLEGLALDFSIFLWFWGHFCVSHRSYSLGCCRYYVHQT